MSARCAQKPPHEVGFRASQVERVGPARWAVSLVGLALLGMLVGGCSSGDDSEASEAEHMAADSARSRHTMLADTRPAECAVEEAPRLLRFR